MTVEDQQLKQRIQDIADLKGSGTQLVSVYITADASLNETVQQLNQEHAEAENIKSKDTRKHVQGALKKILSTLKNYQETPENGIVVFAGYLPEKDDYVVEVFDQFPDPIQESAYHCDKRFYTEPLERSIAADGDYVLIILDKNDAVIGEVIGTSVRAVETFSSLVPGKTKAGGFSQARFRRLREEAKENFFKEITESVNNRYVEERHELNGIFIGAPEPTKTEFIDGEYLHHELQDKIIAETSISTTTEAGLRQLLNECQDVIQGQEITKQRDYCEQFLSGLSTDDEHVAYGVEETLQALDYGAVDTLLVSENLPRDTEDMLMEQTNHEEVLDYLQESIQEYGSDIVFISNEFEEGNQFREAFGGIGAILRYPIN